MQDTEYREEIPIGSVSFILNSSVPVYSCSFAAKIPYHHENDLGSLANRVPNERKGRGVYILRKT